MPVVQAKELRPGDVASGQAGGIEAESWTGNIVGFAILARRPARAVGGGEIDPGSQHVHGVDLPTGAAADRPLDSSRRR